MQHRPTINELRSADAGMGVARRAYRLREIQAETGVPVSTLRTMIRRGELNPITAFGPWLIAVEEYERLLATRLRTEGRISK